MKEQDYIVIFLIALVTFLIGMFVGFYGTADVPMQQEALDDVCVEITGDNAAIFVMGNYEDKTADIFGNSKLICKTPSYDSTQNIIIKSNNEDN